MPRRRDVREARAMECRHEKVAGAADPIAREHPSGAIGAVGGRCEADDAQAGVRIAEAGHRPRPVGIVAKCAPLLAADARAVGAQARTPFARNDRDWNCLQSGQVPGSVLSSGRHDFTRATGRAKGDKNERLSSARIVSLHRGQITISRPTVFRRERATRHFGKELP